MGILAKGTQTTANVEQILYAVPAGKEALCSINICNKSSTASAKVNVGLMLSSESSTQPGGYIEFGATIVPNGILERTGIFLSSEEKIGVTSDVTANVNYVVIGKTDVV